jgi:hypothetical protein
MSNLKIIGFTIIILVITVFLGNVKTARAQIASMEWSGTVDDVVLIRIRNRNAQTRTISGRPYNDDDVIFDRRAPRRNANATVKKKSGRGQVFILQQPNSRNNYTTFVQIVDKKGGSDRYRFLLDWN